MQRHTNQWACKQRAFLIDWITCVCLFGQLRFLSLSLSVFLFLFCGAGRLVWEEIIRRCSHAATQRQKERERPTLASSQTDTNRQLQSEDCCLFGEGKRGEREREREGRGGEKIYLICNCQESIFTCKIASEWERLPRGRNMTAFTRVRMDHHLQPPPPPPPPSSLSFSLHRSIFISLALCFPPSFLPFSPPLPSPLILFSDSITLHFDNPAA